MTLLSREHFIEGKEIPPETIALIVVTGVSHLVAIGILIYIAIQVRKLKMGGKNRKQREDLEAGDPEPVHRPGNQDASASGKQLQQNITGHSRPRPGSGAPTRKGSVLGGVPTPLVGLEHTSPNSARASTAAPDQRQDPFVITPIDENDNIGASSPSSVTRPRVGTKDGRTTIPSVTVNSTTGGTMILV